MRTILSFVLVITSLGLFAQNFPIGQITTTITDPSRNRDIDTEIFYPATTAGSNQPVANGQFPVIVFGHGFSMNFSPYINFWEALVPRGYILIFPKEEIGPIPFPDHAALGQDISFLIDYALNQGNTQGTNFYQKIADKTAVMGHSMGGGCSFLAAESNPNITVLAGFAPAETNTSAIDAALNISVPALLFGGDEDCVTPLNDNVVPMYNNLQSACKHLVVIEDGSHCDFAGSSSLCETGENLSCPFAPNIGRSAQNALVNTWLIPWLDFHLKEACDRWTDFETLVSAAQGVAVTTNCTYTLPEAGLAVIGDTTFCQGDSVVLQGSGGGTYSWSNGAASPNINVQNTGNYFLVVEDSQGCTDTTSTVGVTVNQPETPILQSTGNTAICDNDTLSLNVSGGNFQSYQWSGGATDSSLLVTQAGNYSLTTTDNNGCNDSATITITSLDAPLVYLVPDGPLGICKGDSVTIGTNNSFQSYNWNNGQQSPSLTLSSDTTVYVEVTDTNGCVGWSDTLQVTQYPGPSTPVVSQSNDTLLATGQGSLQWLQDSVAIPGATGGFYTPEDSGYYSVLLTDSNGCTATADDFYYTPPVDTTDTLTAISLAEPAEWRVYPNPVQDIIYIETADTPLQQVTLYNLNGKAVLQTVPETNKTMLDCSILSSGMYVLELLSENSSERRKVLIR